MLQQWIVGIVVVLAAAYALWYWMPAGLRRRLGRVRKSLGEKPGCGACSSCSGCATATEATAGLSRPGAAADSAQALQPLWMRPRP